MSLISLVYVSYSSHDLTDEELKSILEISRTNNQKLDITGMLLYRNQFFIQALEGEESVVMELYNKISQDERHNNVLIVSKDVIPQRSFTDWSMGFNHVTDADLQELDGFTDFLEEETTEFFTEKPGRATILLNSFKERIYF